MSDCSCFHGTAVIDRNGNCGCADTMSDNTTKENCTGVWIDGLGCTGGVRGVVNEPQTGGPTPPFPLDIFGTKRKVTDPACQGLTAPTGYHYILDSSGRCILAVDYDYDTTKYGGNGTKTVTDLLSGAGISDLIANNKGLIGLAVAGMAFYFFSRDKDGTATSRTVISRRGIS